MNAKKQAQDILDKLNGIGTEILNDGCDENNESQNRRFACSSYLIRSLEQASFIEIEGVNMDELWDICREGRDMSYLEEKMNFVIRYCSAIIDICNR